jgi:hypothetical protein
LIDEFKLQSHAQSVIFIYTFKFDRNRVEGVALMWVLLLWMLGLLGLVSAFVSGFWFTVLFWIELQFMVLEEDDWNE